MTKDEALDLALEALVYASSYCDTYDAITAIKQARALDKMADNARELGLDYEPVQQEPVAWLKVIETPGGWGKFVEAKPHEKGAKPVYTSPQPAQRTWVGLTDEDIDELFEYGLAFERPRVIYREIEAKLKEKNNG